MQISDLNARLVWESRRLLRRLGPWTLLAIVLLIVGTAALSAAHLRSRQNAAAAVRIAELRAVPAAWRSSSPASEPAKLRAPFPPLDERHAQLRDVLAAAERAGVQVRVGEYRLKAGPSGAYTSLRVALTLADDYAKIQSMLIDALNRVRTMTLESATFGRPDRKARVVEARLNLIFYFQP
jgi:hypothetical protein